MNNALDGEDRVVTRVLQVLVDADEHLRQILRRRELVGPDPTDHAGVDELVAAAGHDAGLTAARIDTHHRYARTQPHHQPFIQ